MRTVRLLAQLTRQVALVQYPSLTRSAVRHVELVPLAERRLLLVLITDTGRVEQRAVELPAALTDDDSITQLRAVLNACLDGRRLHRGGRSWSPSCPSAVRPSDRPNAAAVFSVTLLETLVERHEERDRASAARPTSTGRPTSPRACTRSSRRSRSRWCCMRLLGESGDQESLTVRIGQRTRCRACSSTSVVSAGYGSGDRRWRKLGVRRSDPDGLPDSDGSGARGGTVRGPDPGGVVGIGGGQRLLRRPRRAPRRRRGRDQEAYRRLARELHPDVNPDPETQERFKEITAGLRGALRPGEAADVRPGRRPVRAGRRRQARRVRRPGSRSATSWTRSSGPAPAPRAAEPGPARPQRHHPGRARPVRVRVRHRPGTWWWTPRWCARPARARAPRRAPTRTTCDVCDGRGEISQVHRSFLGQVMTSRPCPDCGGLRHA